MDASHRILVVCDDAATLERLGKYLGEQGFDVQCAGSEAEAIAIAWDLLAALGLQGLTLELNSLGTPDDRQRYRASFRPGAAGHYGCTVRVLPRHPDVDRHALPGLIVWA